MTVATAAEPAWTGLELARLALDALVPLAVVWLGVVVTRGARRIDAIQQANQTVVARRVQVFTEVAVPLNRLLSFATFVGRWKEITAADALALKRDVDEVVYANRLLFSDPLVEAYREFMACLFAMYATVEGDALIRCAVSSQWGDRRNLPWWDSASAARFATDRASSPEQAEEAYERLSVAFRDDLYVTNLTEPLPRPTTR